MNLNQLFALALDPSWILRAQGIQPDDWQKKLLLSENDRILLCCSRGAGKTRTCSVLALWTALFQPGSLTLLLSRSQRQAIELLRYVKQGFEALGAPIPTRHLSENQMELAHGSRILALPGREETIRSFQGVNLLILDEAARIPDELYFSVRPMLNVSRGRLICLSTPFGARGFFWREWHDEESRWQRTRVTWHDCPRITQEQIDEERRTMGDLWVGQEYECSFLSMHGLVYPDFAEQVVDTEVIPEGRRIGGIDFGWRNPFAAVWGVVDESDVLWIVGEHYVQETTLQDNASRLRSQGVEMWYADPSGAMEIAELRSAGLKVRRADNNIRLGIGAVNARLQSGRLKVLRRRCPNLIREAGLYHYPTSDEQSGSVEIPVDAHNHALDALRYLVAKLDARYLARCR